MNTSTSLRGTATPMAASVPDDDSLPRHAPGEHVTDLGPGGFSRHGDSVPAEPPGSLIESAYGAVEMSWQRLFPGHSDQVPNARRFVRALLTDTAHANDAELIVSELAGNALRHSRSGGPDGHFLVELRRGKMIRIAVYDIGGGGVPRLPGPQEPTLFGEGGRGLFMVAALAESVGCEGSPATGHVVWACLPLDE